MSYCLSFCQVPIAMRVFTSLQLDPTSLDRDKSMIITSHTDRWSIAEMVDDVPVVGSVYEWMRRMAGRTTASVTKVALSTMKNVQPYIHTYMSRFSTNPTLL